MDLLGEGFIGAGQQDKDLRVRSEEFLFADPVQWTVAGDRVNDRPAERKEDDPFPFQGELVEPTASPSGLLLHTAQHNRQFHFDQLVSSLVGNSELESGNPPIRSDDSRAAEYDVRVRTGDAGKQQPGSQRKP